MLYWNILRIIFITIMMLYISITLFICKKNKILEWVFFHIFIIISFIIIIHISLIQKIKTIKNYIPQFASTTIVKDRNNIIMGKLGHEWRDYVTIENIPIKITKTLIATEDTSFYNNIGIHPLSIIYRIIKFFLYKEKTIRGTSTITQQMVRNVFLSHEKSITRKIKEIYLSFYVTKYFKKWQILEIYFNHSAFGKNVYGIKMAAKYYFDKTLQELNNEEIAFIIGVVQGPSFYDGNRKSALVRKNYVLLKMKEYHIISDEEYEMSKKKTLNFKNFTKITSSEYILEEVKEILLSNDMDINDGIIVETTINDKLQKISKTSLNNVINEWKRQNNSSVKINGVVMIIDPKTGEILTSVGGIGFSTSFVDGTRHILRSPGSIMKIFSVLTALENGYNLEDNLYGKGVIFDNKQQKIIYIDDQELLEEYENNSNYKIIKNCPNKYYEPIVFQDVLCQGYNTSIFYLTYILYEQFYDNLIKFQIIEPYQTCYLSMCLGSIFIPIRHIVKCFAPFANGGYKIQDLFLIKKVLKKNKVIYEQTEDKRKEKLIEEDILNKILFMLRRVIDIGSGRRLKSYKYIIGKTGTGQNNREGSLICWNQDMDYLIYVSVYREDYEEIPGLFGATLPLFVTKKILENIEKYNFFSKNNN
ncbi:hypothetical protein AB836_00255 [Rickettsiales bacterium (ex Bugula neritina AB1)]|nr:hypothetical protein AB836_00255 [Rickettsiales bacterium (ex Bugula neritina AB1)]